VGILDARLDDIHGSVENGANGASNGSRDDVVCDLGLFIFGLG